MHASTTRSNTHRRISLSRNRSLRARVKAEWSGTLSSIPSLDTGLGVWDTVFRKAGHMTEFAILGALLLRALGRELPAFAAGVAYAVTDEVHQHFVEGRHASALDVALDGVGVAIGILLFRRLLQTRPASDTGHVA